MLFEEFTELTKADHGKYRFDNMQLYGQYEAINRIYMECDDMTKADAANLWKKTYAKQHDKELSRFLARIPLYEDRERPELEDNETYERTIRELKQAAQRVQQQGISYGPVEDRFIRWECPVTAKFPNGTEYRRLEGVLMTGEGHPDNGRRIKTWVTNHGTGFY